MRPTHDQLLEQLSRLKETPLPDGFEAALQDRLIAASQQSGAVVVPFRRSPRRKVTLVLIAALSVPLAAAAASGVLSHYRHRQPAEDAQPTAEPAKAAATHKAAGRPVAAPAAASTAPASVEPARGSAATSEARPAPSAPERAQRTDSVAAVSRGPTSALQKQGIAPEKPEGEAKAAGAAEPTSAEAQPASAPLEQLDLSWPGGNAAQRTGTKGTPSSSSTSTSSPTTTPSSEPPATSGLRRAGQQQSAGERNRVQNREMRGRTEAGRSSAGGERAQRGGAAQQRQMNSMKRGQ
jgi:hypothetical protein